eukprot:279118_1
MANNKMTLQQRETRIAELDQFDFKASLIQKCGLSLAFFGTMSMAAVRYFPAYRRTNSFVRSMLWPMAGSGIGYIWARRTAEIASAELRALKSDLPNAAQTDRYDHERQQRFQKLSEPWWYSNRIQLMCTALGAGTSWGVYRAYQMPGLTGHQRAIQVRLLFTGCGLAMVFVMLGLKLSSDTSTKKK